MYITSYNRLLKNSEMLNADNNMSDNDFELIKFLVVYKAEQHGIHYDDETNTLFRES